MLTHIRQCLFAPLGAVVLFNTSPALAVPTVKWTPASVNETVVAGESKIVPVSFTASENISNVVVRVVPELQPYVQVNPSTFGRITKGQTINFNVTISAPANTPPGAVVDGTLQLRQTQSTVAKPLPVTLQILASAETAPGTLIGQQGGTVSGPGNTSLTVPTGAVATELPLLVGPIQESNLPLSLTSELRFVGGAVVEAFGNSFNLPIEISVPAPPGLSSNDQFLVAMPVSAQGAYRLQLFDIAELIGGSLVTQQVLGLPFSFPGITIGGIFSFLKPAIPVGFIGGTVTDADGPVVGAIMTISSFPLFVAKTDQNGNYVIPGATGSFTVTAFDPSTGAFASAAGSIATQGAGLRLDISLATPTVVPGTFTNGSFEKSGSCSLNGWNIVGNTTATDGLGTGPDGRRVINPTDGRCLAMISTGGLSVGGASSALRQSFTVPSGKTTLLFNYNFVTEEFPEFVGSVFNDTFRAVLRNPAGNEVQITFEDVNTAVLVPVNGIDFPGGDATTGMTGWRMAAFDVSAFAGTSELLTFSITDAGDTIFDSVILIDNVRFSSGIIAFPFSFPLLEGSSAYTAQITSVNDHSRSEQYTDNNVVTAYTGEAGAFDPTLQHPEQKFRDPVVPLSTHHGFRNPFGTAFRVNNHYTGGSCPKTFPDPGPDAIFGTQDDTTRTLACNTFLYYDGHPGYDYSTGGAEVDVFAVAAGTVTALLSDAGTSCGYLRVDHQDGYHTVYLHLSSYAKTSGNVTRGERLGRTGGINQVGCIKKFTPHLHFEVFKDGFSVDPYGWEGPNVDPYFQGDSTRTSVNLWRPLP
jgi:murein DD-endopeptidase MepM/ murein hydrolase activator NlpD